MGPSQSTCPDWEYSALPNVGPILRSAVTSVMLDLQAGAFDALVHGPDTRPVHQRVFRDLAPAGYTYYAGNYRGSHFRCLQSRRVMVQGDPRVGLPPYLVQSEMNDFGRRLSRSLASLDAHRLAGMRPADHLEHCVVAAAAAFVEFLTIHPYLNGNGHLARFLTWLILMRYGHRPRRWTVEPPPPDRARYVNAIIAARNGYPEDLEELLMASLA
jgi:Fic family protein